MTVKDFLVLCLLCLYVTCGWSCLRCTDFTPLQFGIHSGPYGTHVTHNGPPAPPWLTRFGQQLHPPPPPWLGRFGSQSHPSPPAWLKQFGEQSAPPPPPWLGGFGPQSHPSPPAWLKQFGQNLGPVPPVMFPQFVQQFPRPPNSQMYVPQHQKWLQNSYFNSPQPYKPNVFPTQPPQVQNTATTTGTYQCGVPVNFQKRIYGGTQSNPSKYPWLALLYYDRPKLCEGSLITTRFILTAGHCLQPSDLPRNARFGQTEYDSQNMYLPGVTDISVERSIRNHRKEDIGLVKLSRNVQLSDSITTLCLPTKDIMSKIKKDTMFTFSGWGRSENRELKLKEIQIQNMEIEKCKTKFPNKNMTNRLCAGGEEGVDTCEGDSGGPLMFEHDSVYYAVGVLSYGYRLCGVKGMPSVFVDVNVQMAWIRNTIQYN